MRYIHRGHGTCVSREKAERSEDGSSANHGIIQGKEGYFGERLIEESLEYSDGGSAGLTPVAADFNSAGTYLFCDTKIRTQYISQYLYGTQST